jgi:LacI family transcriptional regulator
MVKRNQIESLRVTLADVAKEANVSMMTVSRVVNNKSGVSDETRKRILSLVEKMGYVPNSLARGLVTKQTKAIGLIVPDNTNPFFAQIARGVEDEAYIQHYSVFVMNTVEDPTREENALDTLFENNIDGLISCSSRLSSRKLESHLGNFSSVVVFNRECQSNLKNVTQINVDDELGAKIAVNYLIDKGRQHIAHINGPTNSISANRRLKGYKEALNIKGYQQNLDANIIFNSEPTYEGGRKAMLKLLKMANQIDAVYAFNDLVAVGALQICKEKKKKVPEDIAIIGVDGAFIGSVVYPQLTTLKIELTEVGRLIMQTLLRNMEKQNVTSSIMLRPELVIRESA